MDSRQADDLTRSAKGFGFWAIQEARIFAEQIEFGGDKADIVDKLIEVRKGHKLLLHHLRQKIKPATMCCGRCWL